MRFSDWSQAPHIDQKLAIDCPLAYSSLEQRSEEEKGVKRLELVRMQSSGCGKFAKYRM